MAWSSIQNDQGQNCSAGYDLDTERQTKKRQAKKNMVPQTIVKDLDKMGSSWAKAWTLAKQLNYVAAPCTCEEV